VSVTNLYHGSNIIFDEISLLKSRDRRDFGRGFYTTTIREQAAEWAKTLSARYGGSAQLYSFDFDQGNSLIIKSFDGLTLEWLDMVKDNRISGGINHNFDVVIGPVANDNTMPTIALYVDGTISAEATLIQLEYYKVNNQVSFHTERALSHLTLCERVSI
jgi:hypothetical protein